MENAAHGKEDQEPRTPSTEEGSDPSQGSLALEGTTSTNTLQLSTYLVPAMPSAIAQGYGGDIMHLENGNFTSKLEGEGEMEEDKKKEHKKRSKNWTRMETLKLIRARSERDDRFRKSGRKAELWEEIAHVLQSPNFSRDGQQCKDKWEKLTAGYKEVRDGARDKEDHQFYNELHELLSWKPYRRTNAVMEDGRINMEATCWKPVEPSPAVNNGNIEVECKESQKNDPSCSRKRKKPEECITSTDLSVVQELLETIINQQQVFFKDMLDTIERKELIREQMRHEREEKWRYEERTQRYVFHNAMIVLTKRLLGDRPPNSAAAIVPAPAPPMAPPHVNNDLVSPKKRSKNWKRTEVLHLIRFRRDMDGRFSKSTRRAGLWDELGEKLATLGINRDGKQCREKWDKLMAEYKDVMDGRKDKEESPYFVELTTFLGKAKPADIEALQELEDRTET